MSPAMVSTLAAMTAMVGVFAAYQIAADLFLRDRSRLNDRVDEEFLQKSKALVKKSNLFKNLGAVAAEAMDGVEAKPGLRQRLEAMVEQSGLDVTAGRLAAIAGGMSGGLMLMAFIVRWSPIDAAVAAALGFVAPFWYVRKKRDARIEKLRSQLPEAFDLMARVVRSGQTLGQSLLSVAEEFPQPISAEFSLCHEQQNLGLAAEVAFRDLARRSGVIELRIFVLAVLVQQQTGGNLAEILIKLADVVRERYQIRGTISTLTAEGRMQGWILAAMPPLMLLLLLVLNPNYAMTLFDHPGVLLGTFGFEAIGALWIRKIVNFDF
ncbi:type II secretion system F family protein [Tundrisphaera sp. TA3]|uniref:type II secretion system F family protein n=1 Tax=Tundrisphaera sp. TA3 TaxID=3435775 RepID=UPI003EBBBE26